MNRVPGRTLAACLVLGLGMLALAAGPARAQDDATCLECHGDESLTKNRGAEVVSLYVDAAKYGKSVHGQQQTACVDCHQDLQGVEDFPHAETLAPVDCAMCHDDVAETYMASLHGQKVKANAPYAPHCWDCHGAHDILPPSEATSRVNKFNIPFMCGGCHKEGTPVSRFYDIPQDSILTHYSESIHGEGLYKRGLTISAVCTDCHTAHNVLPHTDPRSTIARGNVAKTCQVCHGRIEQVHAKVIAGELWEKEPNKVPVCVECHEPHQTRRVIYREGMSNQECLACHTDPRKMAAAPDLLVDNAHLRDSAHHNVTCVQCHTGATPSMARPCATVTGTVDCSICHAEVVQTYATSTHGKLHDRGDPDAPACTGCHGDHLIRKNDDPAAKTYISNIAALCAECHGEGGKAEVRYQGDVEHMVDNYNHSVHGVALSEGGLVVSASCTDCHTAHHVLPQSDVNSSISRAKIAETCASCHTGIYETFKTSIHFTGEPRDGAQLPMCDDCHTSHEITRADAVGFEREIVDHLRPLPRGRHRILLRDLPRQGRQARLHRHRQVPGLPRRPRHPAADRPEIAPLARQHRGHLRAVSPGFASQVRGLPDPRHAPRQGQVPVHPLHVAVHDHACSWAPSSSSGSTRCCGCRGRSRLCATPGSCASRPPARSSSAASSACRATCTS